MLVGSRVPPEVTPCRRATRRCCLAVDGYVRVSKVGGRAGRRFISPTLQREQIHAWANMRGARVLEVFEARRVRRASERPLLQASNSARRGRRFTGRRGRGLGPLRALAGRQPGADRSHPGRRRDVRRGPLNGSISLPTPAVLCCASCSRLPSTSLDRVRSNWDAARAHAIAARRHLGPTPPTGYRRLKSGRPRPGPASPVVSELFARRADGESITRLCRVMEERGVRTPYGTRAGATRACGACSPTAST